MRRRSRSVFTIPSQMPALRHAAYVVIHRRPGRVIVGQQTPSASAAQHIKDPIEDLPHIHTSGSTSWLGRGNQRLKNRPFGIRKITGIGFHRGRSSSLATSFLFMCFYCTTFPQVGSFSQTASPGLLVQPLDEVDQLCLPLISTRWLPVHLYTTFAMASLLAVRP